jgi:hypothetical protein
VSLSVAFLEVYNEAVRDLLVGDSGALEVSGIPAGQLPEGAWRPGCLTKSLMFHVL